MTTPISDMTDLIIAGVAVNSDRQNGTVKILMYVDARHSDKISILEEVARTRAENHLKKVTGLSAEYSEGMSLYPPSQKMMRHG